MNIWISTINILRRVRNLLTQLTVLLLCACAASGPKFGSVQESLPALSDSSGRLFFYRINESYGGGIRADILVCEKKVGESIPGGVFFVDLPSGECNITIPNSLFYRWGTFSNPGVNTMSVLIKPKKTQYVRTWIGGSGFAGRTNMEFVQESVAIDAVRGLALTGQSPPDGREKKEEGRNRDILLFELSDSGV